MKKTTFSLFLLLLIAAGSFAQQKHTFEIKDGNFIYDGKPVQIHSGEMHFARVPRAY